MRALLVLFVAAVSVPLHAERATLHNIQNRDGNLALNEMNLSLPAGWTLVQDGSSESTNEA